MATPRTRITAADVARLSGVSTATVSYVLNSTPGQKISEETRRRVLDAAAELGYVQHAGAQALARGSSRVVLIDTSDIPHGELMDGGVRQIVAGLQRLGYVPLVAPSVTGPDHDALLRLARVITPTAVITAMPLPARIRDELHASGVRGVSSLTVDADDLNQVIGRAAQVQIGFLADEGHRGVVYLEPGESALAGLSEVRTRAASDAAAERGLSLHRVRGGGTIAELAARLDAVLRTHPEVTALAAYNDEIAMAALAALHALGRAVPEQVAVVGIDDLPLAEHTIPALTTVRHVGRGMGGDPAELEDLLAPDAAAPRARFSALLDPQLRRRDSA